jgi:tetratricopeptide (TPR) repeat protein
MAILCPTLGAQYRVQQQAWCGDDDEYSLLFESMYDQPVQRRIFIEECVKEAHPNWGYVYLTNLLTHRIFNVVFTTNFDDLINEACFLYSEGLRPMVSAHDSAVTSMRVTSDRPKIMKLHGDFLYDNIKNTVRELEALEENTRNKLRQFAQEYGLVVVGYGGRDRSVMDTLDVLLRNEDYFPHGVYWCVRPDDVPGKRLQYLLRRERVYLVEIEGFDEFMAEIHESAGLNLPDPIAHPFSVARARAKLFVDDNSGLRRNSVIDKDIQSIHDELQRYPEEVFAQRDHRISAATALLLATIARDNGDLELALRFAKRAVEAEPSDHLSAHIYANVLADLGNYEQLKTFVEESALTMLQKIYYLLRAGANEEVITMAEEALEANPSDWYSRINRAIALKRKGSLEDFEGDLAALEGMKPVERNYGILPRESRLFGIKRKTCCVTSSWHIKTVS